MNHPPEALQKRIKETIRDIPDFPKPGVGFKDITPLLKDPELCKEIVQATAAQIAPMKPDALICLDSRGFWFGLTIAIELNVPMIPVRKRGKLPYTVIAQEYELEYGTGIIEMHTDAVQKNWNVVIHDDILATGGTAEAASRLVKTSGASVAGYSFLIDLTFLNGKEKLKPFSTVIESLISY